VERMPGVSGFIPLPVEHGRLGLGVRWRIARSLRERGYERAVITKRSFKAALIPWMARVPLRTGVLGEARHGLVNDVRSVGGLRHPLWVQRIAALGQDPGEEPLTPEAVPRPRLRARSERVPALLRRLGLDALRKGEDAPVALAPGAAYGPSKRWPSQRWLRLARTLADRGERVWIFGGADEAGLGRRIGEADDGDCRIRDLTGRTDLGEAIDLLGRCSVVVTHDSGLMHVAAALGRRVVALYGSSDPGYTPPLTGRRAVLWKALACSPCFEEACPLGHHACMKGIPVRAVVDALDRGDGLGARDGGGPDRARHGEGRSRDPTPHASARARAHGGGGD